jgi:hypothetical protein
MPKELPKRRVRNSTWLSTRVDARLIVVRPSGFSFVRLPRQAFSSSGFLVRLGRQPSLVRLASSGFPVRLSSSGFFLSPS